MVNKRLGPLGSIGDLTSRTPQGIVEGGGGLQSGPLGTITVASPRHYWVLSTDTTDHGSETAPMSTNNNVDVVSQAPFSEVSRWDVETDYLRTNVSTTVPTTNYSMGCWFRITSFTDTLLVLAAHGDAPDSFSTREFVLGMFRNAGADGYYPWFQFYHSSTRTSIAMSSGDYDISDSDWHHLGIHRSTGKYRIWLDGQLIATSDAAHATVNNTQDFYYLGHTGGSVSTDDIDMAHYYHIPGQLNDAAVASIANSSDVGLTYPTWP